LEIQPVATAKLRIGGDVKEMTNDKCQMTKEARIKNDERAKVRFGFLPFVLRHSFDIRHSDFVVLVIIDASRRRVLPLLSDGG
jgi:hypothetical protein